MSYTWVETFSGAAAIALRLVGGRNLTPPVAWMGGKRRYARVIADAMGVPTGRPSHVVFVDAGPWGWVWPLLLDQGDAAKVAAVLRSWQQEAEASPDGPSFLWKRLASEDFEGETLAGAARWLWLQSRSANGVPVWWSHRWEQGSGEGRPPQPMGQRGRWLASDGRGVPRPAGQKALGGWRMGDKRGGAQAAYEKGKSRGGPGGMVNPATIATRIEAISRAFASVDVRAHHCSADSFTLGRSDPWRCFVYLDPPYVGATGYGWDCPRGEVLAIAKAWCDVGAVVAISEAEPLEIEGWHHIELTRPGGKPEWLTLSCEPARLPAKQLEMFNA